MKNLGSFCDIHFTKELMVFQKRFDWKETLLSVQRLKSGTMEAPKQ